MNPTEQIAHIRLLGALRAKKHYDANRDAINAKRRARYALKHGLTPIQEPEPVPETIQEPEPVPEPVPEQEQEIVVKKGKKNQKPVEPVKEVLTLAVLRKKIKDLGLVKKTESTYLTNMKTLMKVTGCNDLEECLKNPKKIIKLVNASKKRNGDPYKENSKKQYFQTILKLIDILNLPIEKKPYNDQFEVKKVISSDQNDEKKANLKVPLFTEYLKKSRSKYGADSKEYLLGRLYDEFTARDDFGLIMTEEMPDTSHNYLLVKRTYMEVILNVYKTSKKYGQIKYKLKKSLFNITREYILKNKLKMGDYLFGEEQLSSFLSKTNKELGYEGGGSNLFRHMKVAEQTKTASPEEKVELSKIMMHSPIVQKAYLRQLKLI